MVRLKTSAAETLSAQPNLTTEAYPAWKILIQIIRKCPVNGFGRRAPWGLLGR